MTRKWREAMKGAPLSSTELACLAYKAKGLRINEITEIMCIGAKGVSDNLLRARYKLGARTAEELIAIYVEAQVLRSVAAKIPAGTELRFSLLERAESLDPRMDPMCVHEMPMSEACMDCQQTRPGSHDFDGVTFWQDGTGQKCVKCVQCRRWKSDHGRAGERQRRKERNP